MTKYSECSLANCKAYAVAQTPQDKDTAVVPVMKNRLAMTLVGIIAKRTLAVRAVGAIRDGPQGPGVAIR